jgi:cell fate (sporulation/competence/biofilm development) regulator YlbF (YheA/YmcA/DUF963 family)
MSVQTDRLEDLGRDLGEAIAETPEYEAFEEAKAAVEADEAVQSQIAEFHAVRDQYLQARQAGGASQELVREVQSTQEELHAMPKMAEYLDAQEALQDRLESINEAISEPLAVDFGGEAGGCCQD